MFLIELRILMRCSRNNADYEFLDGGLYIPTQIIVELLDSISINNDSKFFSCIMVKSDLIVKLSEQLTYKPTPPPLL